MALTTLLVMAAPAKTETGYALTSGSFPWPDAGERVVFVKGIFHDALVQGEISPDAETWFDYKEPLFKPGTMEVELQPGAYFRLRIQGGTPDKTRITAWI